MDINYIFNSNDVQNSFCVHNSSYIFDSEICINSKFVKKSKNIYNSINIENSENIVKGNMIFNSKNVEESSNIRTSDCITKSKNVVNGIFLQNCTNLKNAMFCSYINNEDYLIFNKPVDSELFNILFQQYNLYFNDIQLSFLIKYVNKDCIILPKLKLNFINQFYKDIPDIFWQWVKTLPNYDEFLLYKMTFKI